MEPGQNIEVVLNFEAPGKPDSYISHYKLVHGSNKKFGPKVWCDIKVELKPQPSLDEI